MFDMVNTYPKSVTVLGAARSGVAAAVYFTNKNIPVFVSDSCPLSKLKSILESNGLGHLTYEAGGHTGKALECELIILSPGIPSDIPVLIEARRRGISVWSEMELGYRASKATILAITGSTGKSTTTSLLGAALEACGKESAVAGNIGIPVIAAVPQLSAGAIAAVEVSSFQLENIDKFCPLGAAVLNFMKNHLDRYNSEDDYYNAKKEIARNFTKENFLVLNASDPRLLDWADQMKSRTNVIFFNRCIEGHDCFWPENGELKYRYAGNTGEILRFDEMKIKGSHNHENACAAAALAKIAGLQDQCIRKGICGFGGLPHRLEFVGEVNGIPYYNDSKSTTAESIVVAVSAFPRVHLIAGGRDKGCDFSVTAEVIRNHAVGIYLIGEAAERMQREWDDLAPVIRASTLLEAIETVAKKAKSGDAVVFSPGCSSFDMFNNYEHRGDTFREIVRSLGKKAL
jgi:UDP-N-acetylmuramoylalanine--D-glutamate ligase